MTDAEINLAIANIEYPDSEFEYDEYDHLIVFHEGEYLTLNYCTNFADIGPIFEREKIPISYSPIYKVWKEGYGMHDFNGRIKDKSLTKTLALCYLKMKGIDDA